MLIPGEDDRPARPSPPSEDDEGNLRAKPKGCRAAGPSPLEDIGNPVATPMHARVSGGAGCLLPQARGLATASVNFAMPENDPRWLVSLLRGYHAPGCNITSPAGVRAVRGAHQGSRVSTGDFVTVVGDPSVYACVCCHCGVLAGQHPAPARRRVPQVRAHYHKGGRRVSRCSTTPTPLNHRFGSYASPTKMLPDP